MANLFEAAVKKTKSAPVKNEKLVLTPSFKGKEEKNFQEDFKKLVKIQAQIAELQAEAASIDEEIRFKGKECFLNYYKENHKNSNSFVMESGDCSVMVIPTDKYKKIDEERADILSKKWGKEVVTVKTVYSFNNDMLEKYQEEISKLISNSKVIDKDDKGKLIDATVTYAVAKGSIDKAPVKKEEEFIEDIQPIFMMKNYKS